MGEIVRLDERDAEEVHDLLKVTWADTYGGILSDSIINTASNVWHSAETLRRQMKNKDVLFLGFREGGELVGMARVASVDSDTVRVFQLYVLPLSQRRGIGRQLMDYLVGQFPGASRLVLNVAKHNEKGISFYRKYGFSFPGETATKVGGEEIEELAGLLELK